MKLSKKTFWAIVIVGALIVIPAIVAAVWYASSACRFGVAAQALELGDYCSAIEDFSKIDNEDSRYYQPALILGIEACAAAGKECPEAAQSGRMFSERLAKFVENTRFTDETFLAHSYYWHNIYSAWYNNHDSVQVDWVEVAEAFENAQFKSDYLTDLARLTAGYVYFIRSYYTNASRMFEMVKNSSDSTIMSWARGYLGLMNLYGESEKYNRRQAYELLQSAPKVGLLAMYRGDAMLVDSRLSLRQRVTRAAECYDSITLPDNMKSTTSFLSNMIIDRKNMVDSLLSNEPWRYPGCSEPVNNFMIFFEGPYTTYLGKDYVADGWGMFTGRDRYGKSIMWCSFGEFNYAKTHFLAERELTFDFRDGYYIVYYATMGHTLWGTTPGINNPAAYSCNVTPLTMNFDLQSLYSNPYSPIYDPKKAN